MAQPNQPHQPGQPGQPGQPVEIALNPQQLQEINNLTASPQFQAFRLQALQNQNILPQILMFIEQNHPNVLPLLQANPQLLIHLLIHGQANVIGAPGQNPGPGQHAPPIANNPGYVAPPPPVPQPTIELSEDDRANVQIIIQMGFNEAQAIEAYLVCNKNVDLAVNYLFDQAN